jgi:2-(1,2-epoxy-1,2-dihydrophenyl)acetyl-CoA isomerase
MDRIFNPMIRAMRDLPKPIVAAVNGVAAGGGANLALACDIVLAAKSASFIEAFCKLGLIPDTGGTWVLPRLIGPARAMGLALLGDKLPAEKAEQWGLIWRCVPDEALMDEAMAMAEHFAAAPTKGLAFTKKAMLASWTNTLEQQLQMEAGMMRELGYSHDYREGVAAFIEKRQPHFKGE